MNNECTGSYNLCEKCQDRTGNLLSCIKKNSQNADK